MPQDSFAPRFFERATRFSERAPSLSERAPDLFERAQRLFDDSGGFLSFGIPLPQKTAERNYKLPISKSKQREESSGDDGGYEEGEDYFI